MKESFIKMDRLVGKPDLASKKALDLNPETLKELGIDEVIQNLEVSMEDDCKTYQIRADLEEVPLELIEGILNLSETNNVQIRNSKVSYSEKICNRINTSYPITFIYDIRSCNSELLKFWEPNAPSFEERLESLKIVNSKGFRTIVFCSYPLDGDTFELAEALSPHCDHLIVEITKKLDEFLFESELTDPIKVQKAEEVLKIQTGDWLLNLGKKLKDNPTVWWDDHTREFLDSKIG